MMVVPKPAVDLWPAYASGNIVGPEHVALAKNVPTGKLVTVNASRAQIEAKRKPRFLQELENFIERELRIISNSKEDRGRELKLQVFREVFDALIEDFRAYRAILARIKNEYELMIAHLRQRIRDLEPLQQLMTTNTAQCEQRLLQMEQKEIEEIEELKQENLMLKQKIANFRQDELAWQEQIRKMQEELANEYRRYRDECDARKLLINDINDLRYQQEEAQQQAAQANKAKSEGIDEDYELLRIGLKEAKKAEAEATKRLNKMIADYADVVPRRDFEKLTKDHEEVSAQLDTITKDFNALHADHKQLLETYKDLKTESKALSKEYEEHKSCSTPRPKWGKASAVIFGGAAKWEKLSEGKTSNELLDVLIEELKKSGGFSEDSAPSFFSALGTDQSVPIYLRCTGKVRNRRLSKRDLLFAITSVWQKRSEGSSSERGEKPLVKFFHDYLRQHMFNEQMVYEWGYNIHMGCQRHHDDDRVKLFFNALSGQQDEEIYHYQQAIFDRTHTKLKQADSSKDGGLSPDTMRWVLADFFPSKNEQRVDALIRAAKLQVDWQDGELIPYSALFVQDDEGSCGYFLEELKDQITAEREEFVNTIIENTNGKLLLEPSQLAEAIQATDTLIPEEFVQRYCCWAFKVSPNELDSSVALPVQDIKERLLNGCVNKIGKEPSIFQ